MSSLDHHLWERVTELELRLVDAQNKADRKAGDRKHLLNRIVQEQVRRFEAEAERDQAIMERDEARKERDARSETITSLVKELLAAEAKSKAPYPRTAEEAFAPVTRAERQSAGLRVGDAVQVTFGIGGREPPYYGRVGKVTEVDDRGARFPYRVTFGGAEGFRNYNRDELRLVC